MKSIGKNLSKKLLILTCLLLSACGVGNVVIQGSFPAPNVNKLPLSIAVLYEDQLKDFSYLEYSERGKEEFNVHTGLSHIALFDSILPAMFENVVHIESMEQAKNILVDAVFVPAIEEFQLAMPAKTKLDVYEVWIKYNMRLLSVEGEYIADWVMTSYGKTPMETFRSRDQAINDAAVVALRDLASSFSLNFASFPEVRDWLSTR